MVFLEDIVGKKDFFFKRNQEGYGLLGYESLSVFEGQFSELQSFLNLNTGKYIFLTLGFDLKNTFYGSQSDNPDYFEFPDIVAFVPKFLIHQKNGSYIKLDQETSQEEMLDTDLSVRGKGEVKPVKWKGVTKEVYTSGFDAIQRHIQRGDTYEVNYCVPFVADTPLDLFATYKNLESLSHAPEGYLFRYKHWEHLGASPERFFKLEGNRITSEPIKGTARRSADTEEDAQIKRTLSENLKERTENVMVVDLVRNDIGKIAEFGTVKVEELCEIRSYKTVHQMVSKITGKVKQDKSLSDVIEALFPMGSMTGVPKKRTLEIIEATESFKRGLYSGSIGVLTPESTVDMNVVMTNRDEFIEVQGTAEGRTFSKKQLDDQLQLAQQGIHQLMLCQRKALGRAWPLD